MEVRTNPLHTLDDETLADLEARVEADLAELEREDLLAATGRPDDEEREIRGRARLEDARVIGIDLDRHRRLDDLSGQRHARLLDVLADRPRPPRQLPDWLFEPPTPVAPDPSFWWARTAPFCTSDFSTGWRKDGLWFSGGANSNGQSLKSSRFGMIAFFELTPDRMPQSSSGRYVSVPEVDLLGMFSASTSGFSLAQGDCWSKCWLHLDQQLFQYGFGQDGPVPITRSQNHERVTLVDEANADRSASIWLPGRREFQPLILRNPNPAESLWARLEVRFDVQTEGVAHLWLDTDVMINTYHWPLVPL